MNRTPYRGIAGYRRREDDEGHAATEPRTMRARYAGKCVETGARIEPGDTIQMTRRGAVLIQSQPSATAGRYVSDVFRTSGGEFYRNKNGRCEDAPCCGCCTI